MIRPFIVAELSAEHMGSLERAHQLIRAANWAGADAVKLQCYLPEQMVDEERTIVGGPWHGRRAIELYRENWTPREWFPELFVHARRVGMVAFASVFHPDDVDFLETIHCPIYKIASFELTDSDLIQHAARTKKPLIISTGMGTDHEIAIALSNAYAAFCTDLTLLKCTSAYPAPMEELNLHAMPELGAWQYANQLPAFGLSDHTLGATAAIVATTLGASVIEKHLTLDRETGGSDAAFSATPEELKFLVASCREAVAALGPAWSPTELRQAGPTRSEMPSLQLRRPPGGKRGE